MVVDISDVYHRKLELLRMHASQFAKTAEDFGVLPLGMNDYLFGLGSRDRFFGSLIGVHHGEACFRQLRSDGADQAGWLELHGVTPPPFTLTAISGLPRWSHQN